MNTGLSAEQLKQLASPLDAGRVKKRQGRGNGPALSYLETHDVIRAANDIFGFGMWGHEITELREIPAVAVAKDGKAGIHVGYLCIVRLTVAGCVPVSGTGYGDAVEYNQSGPVTAHELAAKEAESDALKRALKNLGDQFGLALYDKQAASSGHVAGAGSGADGSSSPPAAATPVVPPAALTAFRKLAETYKVLKPEFDVEAAMSATDGKDAGWVARQTKRLEENIQAASKPEFKVPAGVS